MDPPAIIDADPDMAAVWSDIIGTSADAHYGRAFAFHQQAQQQDWTTAWGRIAVPVLVVMGEYDWFEIIPQMDHHFTVFPDARTAFGGDGGEADAHPFLELALTWLEAI